MIFSKLANLSNTSTSITQVTNAISEPDFDY